MWLSNHLKDVSATEELDGARSRDQEFGHVRVRYFTQLRRQFLISMYFMDNIYCIVSACKYTAEDGPQICNWDICENLIVHESDIWCQMESLRHHMTITLLL